MLTLRQIEVIRAVMVTGTVSGAARMLNVSAPGISRVMKHAESLLGLNLFSRRQGRYVPTPEAKDIFAQINAVYEKVEDLQFVIAKIESGTDAVMKIGSVPSIATVMVPQAIGKLRAKFPKLLIDVDILKLEEAIDYLLLGRGEAVAMSHHYDHPTLTFEPLVRGRLYCITRDGHPLAARATVKPQDIVRYPLIGIDASDPYGRIMASVFLDQGLPYDISIRARFGTTVCALVRQGVGVAVIDEFTIADGGFTGISRIALAGSPEFQTYVAYRKDATLSSFTRAFIAFLRAEMSQARRRDDGARSRRSPKKLT